MHSAFLLRSAQEPAATSGVVDPYSTAMVVALHAVIVQGLSVDLSPNRCSIAVKAYFDAELSMSTLHIGYPYTRSPCSLESLHQRPRGWAR